jgi:hypothetical protein
MWWFSWPFTSVWVLVRTVGVRLGTLVWRNRVSFRPTLALLAVILQRTVFVITEPQNLCKEDLACCSDYDLKL